MKYETARLELVGDVQSVVLANGSTSTPDNEPQEFYPLGVTGGLDE